MNDYAIKNLSFPEALHHLKANAYIQRKGWYGKGMFLRKESASIVSVEDLKDPQIAEYAKQLGHSFNEAVIAQHIDIVNADGHLQVGWNPTQADLFANDWQVIKPSDSHKGATPPDSDFSAALKLVKDGYPVCRKGWNGVKMFVFERPADTLHPDVVEKVKSLPNYVKLYLAELSKEIPFGRYLCLCTPDRSIANGWIPSQADLFADDWQIADFVTKESVVVE